MNDERSFDEVYAAYRPQVYAYAVRRVGADDAGDITNETFAAVWRNRHKLPGEPLPWLLGVARNKVLNHRRTSRRQDSLRLRLMHEQDNARRFVNQAGGDARIPPVIEALDQLTPLDREAITLVAWEGLRPREAALVLGVSPVAFRVRLHRAKNRLRMLLRDAAPHVRRVGDHDVDEITRRKDDHVAEAQ